MSLSEGFNRTHTAVKINDSILQVGTTYFNYYYDFVQRVVVSGSGNIMPFSQMDREVLVMAHDKLVELGGKPPALPPEAPVAPVKTGKFNL